MNQREPDLRELARRQRWMVWLVLLAAASQCSPAFFIGGAASAGMIVAVVSILLLLLIYVLLVVGVVLLLVAKRSHIAVIILCGFLTLAPCINLVVLVFVNASATRTLKRAGLHVGLMGVKDEEVERITDAGLCSGCGYNLTGNVSGYCPECGRPI